ncbi:hypothetical protein ANN_11014 [Periplaneta americana]|uniref:Tc1-like transposase DDE domain-containing protein n=1 Tax=Periplaneta americana TaxID=6978 RepID=A0ABQ8T3U9_PERAM|nr:hypothetical protein ANN_11014 [Periplaneta americana]
MDNTEGRNPLRGISLRQPADGLVRTHRHDTTVHDVIRLLIPALYKNQSDSLMAADGGCHHLCKLMAPVRRRWSINDVIDGIRNTVMPSNCSPVRFGICSWCLYRRAEAPSSSHDYKHSHPIPKAIMEKSLFSKNYVQLNYYGLMHHEFIPEGRTVTKELYVETLRRLWDAVRRKRPEKWVENNWFLMHDNAPAHRAIIVKNFLARHNITALDHPPYSPDLSPPDYFLFPRLKSSAIKTLIRMRLVCAALIALLVACASSLPVPRQDQLAARVQPQGPLPSETYDARGLPPEVKQVVVKVHFRLCANPVFQEYRLFSVVKFNKPKMGTKIHPNLYRHQVSWQATQP